MDVVYGCDGCRTTIGRGGCAIHRDQSPSPGANLYITNCVHGLDLRVHPRCYLCRPVATESTMDADWLASVLWQIECLRSSGDYPHLGDESDCRRLAERIVRFAESKS